MSLEIERSRSNLSDRFPILDVPYKWRAVTSYYRDGLPPVKLISNVHVVPFIGDRVVLLHTSESGWGPSGGTLLENEEVTTTVDRELHEEIGASVSRFELFGRWDSVSSAKVPYRPWLPHPHFAIALGWADVTISGSPCDDGGVEMESVLEVSILPVNQAAERLTTAGKPHLAALYQLAFEIRKTRQEARS